jgi:membrane protease YdiL (CAAX protease family)
MIPRWAFMAGAIFALIHLVLCLIIVAQHFDRGYGGVMIFLISLPASYVFMRSGSLAMTIIGGSLQWFLLGVGFSCLLAITHKWCMRHIAKEDQHLDRF